VGEQVAASTKKEELVFTGDQRLKESF